MSGAESLRGGGGLEKSRKVLFIGRGRLWRPPLALVGGAHVRGVGVVDVKGLVVGVWEGEWWVDSWWRWRAMRPAGHGK
eukprot:1031328-Prymnesium_polylepis.1